MTSHDATPTPGPWTIGDTYRTSRSIHGFDFRLIATVFDGPNMESDAALIASAPALAEENARLVVILQEIRSWCAEEENSGPLADPMETLREIRSFIHAALAPKEPADV